MYLLWYILCYGSLETFEPIIYIVLDWAMMVGEQNYKFKRFLVAVVMLEQNSQHLNIVSSIVFPSDNCVWVKTWIT